MFIKNTYQKSKRFGSLIFLPAHCHLPAHFHSLSGGNSSALSEVGRPGHRAMSSVDTREFCISYSPGAYCFTANQHYSFYFLGKYFLQILIFLRKITFLKLHVPAPWKWHHWIQSICYDLQLGYKYLPFCLLSSRERYSYFKEWMNLFDLLGQLLILCIIPLRYCDSNAQWMVASLAFLFNCLRIFKFSCVTR